MNQFDLRELETFYEQKGANHEPNRQLQRSDGTPTLNLLAGLSGARKSRPHNAKRQKIGQSASVDVGLTRSIQKIYTAAIDEYIFGSPEKALELAREVQQKAPRFAPVCLLIGRIHSKIGDHDKMLVAFIMAALINGTRSDWLTLTRMAYSHNLLEHASYCAKRALDQSKNLPPGHPERKFTVFLQRIVTNSSWVTASQFPAETRQLILDCVKYGYQIYTPPDSSILLGDDSVNEQPTITIHSQEAVSSAHSEQSASQASSSSCTSMQSLGLPPLSDISALAMASTINQIYIRSALDGHMYALSAFYDGDSRKEVLTTLEGLLLQIPPPRLPQFLHPAFKDTTLHSLPGSTHSSNYRRQLGPPRYRYPQSSVYDESYDDRVAFLPLEEAVDSLPTSSTDQFLQDIEKGTGWLLQRSLSSSVLLNGPPSSSYSKSSSVDHQTQAEGSRTAEIPPISLWSDLQHFVAQAAVTLPEDMKQKATVASLLSDGANRVLHDKGITLSELEATEQAKGVVSRAKRILKLRINSMSDEGLVSKGKPIGMDAGEDDAGSTGYDDLSDSDEDDTDINLDGDEDVSGKAGKVSSEEKLQRLKDDLERMQQVTMSLYDAGFDSTILSHYVGGCLQEGMFQEGILMICHLLRNAINALSIPQKQRFDAYSVQILLDYHKHHKTDGIYTLISDNNCDNAELADQFDYINDDIELQATLLDNPPVISPTSSSQPPLLAETPEGDDGRSISSSGGSSSSSSHDINNGLNLSNISGERSEERHYYDESTLTDSDKLSHLPNSEQVAHGSLYRDRFIKIGDNHYASSQWDTTPMASTLSPLPEFHLCSIDCRHGDNDRHYSVGTTNLRTDVAMSPGDVHNSTISHTNIKKKARKPKTPKPTAPSNTPKSSQSSTSKSAQPLTAEQIRQAFAKALTSNASPNSTEVTSLLGDPMPPNRGSPAASPTSRHRNKPHPPLPPPPPPPPPPSPPPLSPPPPPRSTLSPKTSASSSPPNLNPTSHSPPHSAQQRYHPHQHQQRDQRQEQQQAKSHLAPLVNMLWDHLPWFRRRICIQLSILLTRHSIIDISKLLSQLITPLNEYWTTLRDFKSENLSPSEIQQEQQSSLPFPSSFGEPFPEDDDQQGPDHIDIVDGTNRSPESSSSKPNMRIIPLSLLRTMTTGHRFILALLTLPSELFLSKALYDISHILTVDLRSPCDALSSHCSQAPRKGKHNCDGMLSENLWNLMDDVDEMLDEFDGDEDEDEDGDNEIMSLDEEHPSLPEGTHEQISAVVISLTDYRLALLEAASGMMSLGNIVKAMQLLDIRTCVMDKLINDLTSTAKSCRGGISNYLTSLINTLRSASHDHDMIAEGHRAICLRQLLALEQGKKGPLGQSLSDPRLKQLDLLCAVEPIDPTCVTILNLNRERDEKEGKEEDVWASLGLPSPPPAPRVSSPSKDSVFPDQNDMKGLSTRRTKWCRLHALILSIQGLTKATSCLSERMGHQILRILKTKDVLETQLKENDRNYALRAGCSASDLVILPDVRSSHAWRTDTTDSEPAKARRELVDYFLGNRRSWLSYSEIMALTSDWLAYLHVLGDVPLVLELAKARMELLRIVAPNIPADASNSGNDDRVLSSYALLFDLYSTSLHLGQSDLIEFYGSCCQHQMTRADDESRPLDVLLQEEAISQKAIIKSIRNLEDAWVRLFRLHEAILGIRSYQRALRYHKKHQNKVNRTRSESLQKRRDYLAQLDIDQSSDKEQKHPIETTLEMKRWPAPALFGEPNADVDKIRLLSGSFFKQTLLQSFPDTLTILIPSLKVYQDLQSQFFPTMSFTTLIPHRTRPLSESVRSKYVTEFQSLLNKIYQGQMLSECLGRPSQTSANSRIVVARVKKSMVQRFSTGLSSSLSTTDMTRSVQPFRTSNNGRSVSNLELKRRSERNGIPPSDDVSELTRIQELRKRSSLPPLTDADHDFGSALSVEELILIRNDTKEVSVGQTYKLRKSTVDSWLAGIRDPCAFDSSMTALPNMTNPLALVSPLCSVALFTSLVTVLTSTTASTEIQRQAVMMGITMICDTIEASGYCREYDLSNSTEVQKSVQEFMSVSSASNGGLLRPGSRKHYVKLVRSLFESSDSCKQLPTFNAVDFILCNKEANLTPSENTMKKAPVDAALPFRTRSAILTTSFWNAAWLVVMSGLHHAPYPSVLKCIDMLNLLGYRLDLLQTLACNSNDLTTRPVYRCLLSLGMLSAILALKHPMCMLLFNNYALPPPSTYSFTTRVNDLFSMTSLSQATAFLLHKAERHLHSVLSCCSTLSSSYQALSLLRSYVGSVKRLTRVVKFLPRNITQHPLAAVYHGNALARTHTVAAREKYRLAERGLLAILNGSSNEIKDDYLVPQLLASTTAQLADSTLPESKRAELIMSLTTSVMKRNELLGGSLHTRYNLGRILQYSKMGELATPFYQQVLADVESLTQMQSVDPECCHLSQQSSSHTKSGRTSMDMQLSAARMLQEFCVPWCQYPCQSCPQSASVLGNLDTGINESHIDLLQDGEELTNVCTAIVQDNSCRLNPIPLQQIGFFGAHALALLQAKSGDTGNINMTELYRLFANLDISTQRE